MRFIHKTWQKQNPEKDASQFPQKNKAAQLFLT